MSDQPQDSFEQMLDHVHVNQRILEGIHRDLIEVITQRPRLNNDDLTAAAKLIAGELTSLKIKEAEIRHFQNNPSQPQSPGAN